MLKLPENDEGAKQASKEAIIASVIILLITIIILAFRKV
jgi:hypothetical protein